MKLFQPKKVTSVVLTFSLLLATQAFASSKGEEDQKILSVNAGVPQIDYTHKGLVCSSIPDLRQLPPQTATAPISATASSASSSSSSVSSVSVSISSENSKEKDTKELAAQPKNQNTTEDLFTRHQSLLEQHNKAVGTGITIDSPSNWLKNQMVRRFDAPHKNPWHAVIAADSTGKLLGIIGLGMFPTTTYVDTKPESGHPAIKAFFMKMGLIDAQNKPVDNAGLAHFVMAFDPQSSQDERFLCVEAAVVISKSLASRKSPLPRFGHLPKALMVMAERGDKEAAAIYGKLGFTLSEDNVWDLFYPGKKRVAFFMNF